MNRSKYQAAFLAVATLVASCFVPGPVALASDDNLKNDIYGSHVVPEPLIALGPTSDAEDRMLARALVNYQPEPSVERLVFDTFLKRFPTSNWREAILVNRGLIDYQAGYFDRAIEAFTLAWKSAKNATEPRQKALADRAVGELIRMHARLGHADELAGLLKQIEGRPISGSAAGWIEGAREGLYEMRHNPGIAYLCGPMAVKNILLSLDPESQKIDVLDRFRSGPHGVDFATVETLAHQVGLDYRKAYIANPGTALPLPAVVHWRVNHYAAVVSLRDGRYEVKDPTFGQETLWITPAALAAESDGYYLIPTKSAGLAIASVSTAKAQAIYGRGFTQSSDTNSTTPKDTNACDCHTKGTGMPTADAKALLASLTLTDTPLAYTPPKGPAMNLTVTYNHLDVTQPANITYTSLGPQWSMNWIAFIRDTPTNASASVVRVFGGGGAVVDSGCSAWNCQFAREGLTGDILTRVRDADGRVVYTLTDRDGAQWIYAHSDGATSGTRRVFLTEVRDAQGNAATLTYDGNLRLTAVNDALGQPLNFAYDDASYPFNITGATDVAGRTVSFVYDDAGRLAAITDVIGLTTTFRYDDVRYADFISSMTTPYGINTYAYQSGTFAGGDGRQHPYRILTLTDPRGDTQKIEYYVGDSTHLNVPASEPTAKVPTGTEIGLTNSYLEYRNTFYWNAEAYRQNSNDWSLAKVYHFHHLANNQTQTARSLESVKLPLQNRVWYTYAGQPSSNRSGSLLADPSDIAYVINNNSSRTSSVTHRVYNARTNVTCYRDPAGRVTRYDYAANGIDRLNVRQGRSGANCSSTAGSYDLVEQYTYNDRHEPLTFTDAANQTTRYTYDAAGLLISQTDALGQKTTYARDANGYLMSITGPAGEALSASTYDALGRPLSQTDAGEETIQYSWDSLNRLTEIDFPDGTARVYAYDRLDLSTVTDRLSHTTRYGYDASRNKVSMTDPLTQTTTFSYDHNNRLAGMVDANGGQTQWQHDIQGRTTAKTHADGSSVTYAYAPETGWLSTQTDELGQTTRYGYTTDGRPQTIDYQNALIATPSVTYGYDPNYPRTTTMTDGTGTTTYSYYPVGVLGANRLQTVQTPRPAAEVRYVYDELGRAARRTIDGIAQSFSYDDLHRVTSEQNSLSTFVYTYLGATNQVTSVTPGGSPFRVTYDYLDNIHDRRLKKITNGTHGKGLQQLDYETDAENQTVRIAAHDAAAVHYDYAYDAKHRLVQADEFGYGAPRKRDYTYDALDNLQQVAADDHVGSSLFEADYNSRNQIKSANGSGFVYDAAGELVADNKFTYAWDAAHRLLSATNIVTGAVTHYVYDGVGHRVAITAERLQDGSINIDYLWCDDKPCQARESSGGVSAEYFDQGEIQNAARFFYVRDRLGSVTGLVDPDRGTLEASYAYDPWGNVTASSGPLTPAFGFASMFVDHSTGQNLTLYRVYDPNTARWISEDPIGLLGGLNEYAYSGDDPINLRDPSGLLWDPPAGLVDFGAGFGDAVLIFPRYVREYFNVGAVNQCSRYYTAGEWTGVIVDIAVGGAAGLEAAGTKGVGKEFSHWIPNRMGGPRSIWNGNFVSAAWHYFHDPFRFPRGWRDLGPKWPAWLQQFDRIPNVFKGGAGAGGYGYSAMESSDCECAQ
jgi:RHS repeat-associated protein